MMKSFYEEIVLVEMIEAYILYYNTQRVKRNLGILTPMEKHTMLLAA